MDVIYATYGVAASGVLSTAAVARRIIGPPSLTGRIVAASAIITTGTTDAASAIKVGPAGGTAGDSLTMSVPILAANAGHQATISELRAGGQLSADTVYEVSGDGAATAGAADIDITVAWSKTAIDILNQ